MTWWFLKAKLSVVGWNWIGTVYYVAYTNSNHDLPKAISTNQSNPKLKISVQVDCNGCGANGSFTCLQSSSWHNPIFVWNSTFWQTLCGFGKAVPFLSWPMKAPKLALASFIYIKKCQPGKGQWDFHMVTKNYRVSGLMKFPRTQFFLMHLKHHDSAFASTRRSNQPGWCSSFKNKRHSFENLTTSWGHR